MRYSTWHEIVTSAMKPSSTLAETEYELCNSSTGVIVRPDKSAIDGRLVCASCAENLLQVGENIG